MTQAKQPEAIKLASEYRETMPADVLHLWAGEVVGELRRLHAENATLRSGYDASRLEIESLRARVQELGEMLRENRSKRIVALETENLGLLHALAAEQDANTGLCQQLEAIGAGGVEPLRRRDHFRDVTEMVPDQFRDATKMMQAVAQALEALEAAVSDDRPYFRKSKAAIAALREAMEAPAQTAAVAQEPVALLVRKNSWRDGQWEAAPPNSPHYGLSWADKRMYVYSAPQPTKPAPNA